MINRLLLALFFVLFWSGHVRSQIENEVRRGVFPFMAILYYPDKSVVDSTGARFQHSAVLIKPAWLLSSAFGLGDNSLGFPQKTLLARMGALTIDANFTLNEDEDEEEREVIQIVIPSTHSVDAWWLTDITLLQTLLPFKRSSVIAPTTFSPTRSYDEKYCSILVYAKRYTISTEDKVLMQLRVEMLVASEENCGQRFTKNTMTCATPSDDMKTSTYDPQFCQGNSGGPLICEGEVMGLQTYIENSCKQPYLYQLLAPWDTFINCGIEQKCSAYSECNVCKSLYKDSAKNQPTTLPRAIVEADTEKEASSIDQSPMRTEYSSLVQTDSTHETIFAHGSESSIVDVTELAASTAESTEPSKMERIEFPAVQLADSQQQSKSLSSRQTESLASEPTKSSVSQRIESSTQQQSESFTRQQSDLNDSTSMEKTETVPSEYTEYPIMQQSSSPDTELNEISTMNETATRTSEQTESKQSETPQQLVDFLNYMNEESVNLNTTTENNSTEPSVTPWQKVGFVSKEDDNGSVPNTRVEAQVQRRVKPVRMVYKHSSASKCSIQSLLLLTVITFLIFFIN